MLSDASPRKLYIWLQLVLYIFWIVYFELSINSIEFSKMYHLVSVGRITALLSSNRFWQQELRSWTCLKPILPNMQDQTSCILNINRGGLHLHDHCLFQNGKWIIFYSLISRSFMVLMLPLEHESIGYQTTSNSRLNTPTCWFSSISTMLFSTFRYEFIKHAGSFFKHRFRF